MNTPVFTIDGCASGRFQIPPEEWMTEELFGMKRMCLGIKGGLPSPRKLLEHAALLDL